MLSKTKPKAQKEDDVNDKCSRDTEDASAELRESNRRELLSEDG